MADGGGVDMSAARRRQGNEAKMWMKPVFASKTNGCTVELPDPENVLNVILKVPGPDNYVVNGKERPCPYKGHTFRVKVTLHETYPFKCPEVEFMDVPYHPNCAPTGEVCMDALNESWKPTKNLTDVAKTVYALLQQPDPGHAADADVGSHMSKDLKAFEDKARSLGGRAPTAKSDS